MAAGARGLSAVLIAYGVIASMAACGLAAEADRRLRVIPTPFKHTRLVLPPPPPPAAAARGRTDGYLYQRGLGAMTNRQCMYRYSIGFREAQQGVSPRLAVGHNVLYCLYLSIFPSY
eukprot:GHVU01138097.1.p1 GENE.GHVU01138097.1~~GHVU01138097.1.p1  ORF type:complete len:125 (+),score=22.03 GHVU01138097.1:26-376(+)